MPTPFYIDYGNVEVELFVQAYRRRFKTEPSSFAFRGYDLGMHLIPNLGSVTQFGLDYLTTVEETGLQSKFGWTRLQDGGLENTVPHIVDYTNYELKIASD